MKRRIITDNLDLTDKKEWFYEDFYKGKKSIQAYDSSSTVNKEKVVSYYGLVSTSDKEINCRKYDKESWKKTVIDGTWIKPFGRPIMRNHDVYFGDSVGRITESYFYDHSTEVVTSDSVENSLPKDVLDFYKEKGAFSNGSGSVIVKFELDAKTAERVDSGLDMTLSQSSIMNSATCNICGKDYYSGDCNHVAGETFQIEEDGVKKDVKCVVYTKDYEPVELSIVNFPANDTSIIYKRKNEVNASNQDNKQSTKDNVNAENKITKDTKIESDKGEVMYKELAKKHFLSKLEDFKLGEDGINTMSDFFETLKEDQLDKIDNVIDLFKTSKDEAVKEISDAFEQYKAEQETKTEEKIEDKKEPEIKEEKQEEKTEDKTSEEKTEESEIKEEKPEDKKEDNKEAIAKFYNDEVTAKPVMYNNEIMAMLKNNFN